MENGQDEKMRTFVEDLLRKLNRSPWPINLNETTYKIVRSLQQAEILEMPITASKRKQMVKQITQIIANYRHLTQIQITDEIDDDDFVLFRRNKWWNIQTFCLKLANVYTCITQKSVNLLISFSWPSLQQLELSGCNLDMNCATILSEGDWPCLQKLILDKNNIQDKGLEKITKGNWPQLRNLSIVAISPSRLSLKAFSTMKWFLIESLNLGKNSISWQGIKELIRANFENLKELKLQSCKLSDECLIELSKGKWEHLKKLYLSCNSSVSNRGLMHLRKANWRYGLLIAIDFTDKTLESVRHSTHALWTQRDTVSETVFDNYSQMEKRKNCFS